MAYLCINKEGEEIPSITNKNEPGNAPGNKMKTIKVMFGNEKYNYTTSINPNCSHEDICKYFVGNIFNVGSYPEEILMKCIGIEYV